MIFWLFFVYLILLLFLYFFVKLFDGGGDFFAKRFFLLEILVGRFVFGLGAFHDSQHFQVFPSFAINFFGRAFDCVFGGSAVFLECHFLDGFVIPAGAGYIKRFEHIVIGALTQVDG